MTARLLDGTSAAAAWRAAIAADARAVVDDLGYAPVLATVIAPGDPSSAAYARAISRACARAGVGSRVVELPNGGTDAELVACLRELNADDHVHGIIVQLPLPPAYTAAAVGATLAPEKDVDGVTPLSAGLLALGRPTYVPATPLGGMELLRHHGIGVRGMRATVVGRSAVIGRPLAMLLIAEGATVTVKGKDGKMLAAVPGKPEGGTPEKAVAHPDRKAAEYVLSVGGAVRIDGQEVEIKNVADLPKERFNLTGINLQRKQVTNEGLATMKDCKNLTHLWLHDTNVTDEDLAYFKNFKGLINLDLLVTKVTDAGLANFKDFKEIKFLDLAYTGITDEGLAYFKDCKGLRTLSIGATKVTDAGLVHLKDCNEPMTLFLTNTAVTDAGLAHLKNCKGLRGIDLRNTKVTEKGLADFHAAVPGCKIQYNGGVIQPKQ